MPSVGAGEIATLVVDDFDGTTVATLAVISPARAATVVGVTSDDDGNTWTGVVPAYSVAGIWYHRWTVVGAGAGIREIPVAVEPRASASAAPRSYATTTQLAAYLGEAPPLDAEGKLHRATTRVDGLLKSSVYPVDEDGEPTDTDHQAALADAVCELVAWWLDTGDESGQLSASGSMTAGQISLSRGGGKTIQVGGQWVPAQVIVILSNAGLWGHAPWTY